ncbi:uncharacterized protein LOC117639554 isoform X1 [Thrips palmi]|nr:uncharacterized protein LOC117639554 isoform X1 [Thrips palmi]XP_034231231.1 uncharacterized protein LOC117639554 isoform X1 [Thrips palmi]XP_034231233.1 uncharacterized protein LOC117639554 isoform X1 [Thrips palmi]XP_034231234.1 uncharacterized protein LOC117639554 isoform X1 [Thrips palmi]XP_034231235.1 uncharacterized protein LOC117639554 isoform X1 [Thrips palmi]XP_034231236.1 uncharacterized protein LOC117639554 isoform X1 [Thrips palmi]
MAEKALGFEGYEEKSRPSPPPKYDEAHLHQYPQRGDGFSTPPYQLNQHPPQHGGGFSNPPHQLMQYPPQDGGVVPNAPLLTPQPPAPAPVTNVTINASPPAAQQPVIVNNIVGGGMMACSKCGSNFVSVKMESSCKTHCCCLICCFTLPFCFFLPYCCDWCKKPVQRCSRCKAKLG